MKFAIISDWYKKNLQCHFCGETRSVKYEMNVDGATVCACNKCVLLQCK